MGFQFKGGKMDTQQTAIITVGIEDAAKRLNRCRTWIYDRLNPKSPKYDPSFPRPVKFDAGGKNVFIESELNAWLSVQIHKSRSIQGAQQ
jgi:prophage regulatory protein